GRYHDRQLAGRFGGGRTGRETVLYPWERRQEVVLYARVFHVHASNPTAITVITQPNQSPYFTYGVFPSRISTFALSTPGLKIGSSSTISPRALITVVSPVLVTRTSVRRVSMERSCDRRACWYGATVRPNHASFVRLTRRSAPFSATA